MKKLIYLSVLLVTIISLLGCDLNPLELSSTYLGAWIAQSYDVSGTANDYVLADLTNDPNENKTYRNQLEW